MSDPILPRQGGYRGLKSFQIAQLVYDLTVVFCDRYVDPRSRTHDQMVQAARSGVQNIAEGSQVSATSRKMEMKLIGVARASLEDLRLDYEDFLRRRDLPVWAPDHPRRRELIERRCRSVAEVGAWVREVRRSRPPNGPDGPDGPDGPELSIPSIPSMSELAANTVLTLIVVSCSLLDRQLAAQAEAFERSGGFTERLFRARSERRR